MEKIVYSLKKIIKILFEPKYCLSKFLKIINHNGKLLDVGCGNNSPYLIKTKYPNIVYYGIDVDDYHQTKPNLADSYIVVKPEDFAETIEKLQENFDTVISSHNLEHCNDRDKTLDAIIKKLKSGGYLFLSFPTEKSENLRLIPFWRKLRSYELYYQFPLQVTSEKRLFVRNTGAYCTSGLYQVSPKE